MKVTMMPPMTLLPPAAHLCQECAVDHPPTDPHNQQTLFYQTKFNMAHGRWATWTDAMTHCTPEVKARWTAELKRLGQDVPEVFPDNPPNVINYWPCACVKRGKDGKMQAIKLNPPSRRRCPVCKQTPLAPAQRIRKKS